MNRLQDANVVNPLKMGHVKVLTTKLIKESGVQEETKNEWSSDNVCYRSEPSRLSSFLISKNED